MPTQAIDTPPVPAIAAPAARPAPRLHFLDGLRALAALWVVLNHIWAEVTERPDAALLPAALRRGLAWLGWAHYAVDVFIVLSGFCLMLPIVRAGGGALRGGLSGFLKRRARRILPPYYVALLLSLLLIALVPGLRHGDGTHWDKSLPAFRVDVIVAHLLLVHNLSPAWSPKINMAMWSVATEWQIYFVFALALLPVWRRWGSLATVAAAFAGALVLHVGTHGRFDLACPHFVGLFALGMAAADIARRPTHIGRAGRWMAAAAVLFGLTLAITWRDPSRLEYHCDQLDPLAGLATACLLIGCCLQTERRGWVLRALEVRPLVALGVFSYSLYLVHYPLLAALHWGLMAHGVTPLASLALLTSLGVPCVVAASYAFHRAFEMPFMNAPSRRPAGRLVAAEQK